MTRSSSILASFAPLLVLALPGCLGDTPDPSLDSAGAPAGVPFAPGSVTHRDATAAPAPVGADLDGDGYDDTVDCDDNDATAYPGAVEADDLVDDDCDGWVDEDFVATGDIVVSEVNRRSLVGTGAIVNNASWVEVYNASDRTVDLSNWVIARGTSASGNQVWLDAATAPILAAGEYAVFCDTNDYEGSAATYPLTCDYVWGDESQGSTYIGTYHDNTWYLRRDKDTFALYIGGNRTTGTLVDSVSWTYDATNGYWPRDARFSMSLDPAYLDGTLNDQKSAWCSTTSSASGAVAGSATWRWHDTSGTNLDEYGTPGAANYDCPSDPDLDGDGYTGADDCDDGDATVNPGATEACDGVDNDCDGTVDQGISGTTTWYADADGDGYGDAAASLLACDQPAGYVTDDTDCDDTTAAAWPGATEACDGIDNDCDGTLDDGLAGTTWYADADGDGYGDAASTTTACAQPPAHSSDATDCDDASATTHPGADETCDGVDNDCDTTIDEDGVDGATWYLDDDADGDGVATTTATACDQPAGYAATDTDCDDADASVYTGAVEFDDQVDQDCDGWVDEDFVAVGDLVVTEVNRRSLVASGAIVNNASWVEVYNASSRTVDLSNWVIARGNTWSGNQVYLDPTAAPVLGAGEYAVFCDSDDYVGSTAAYPLSCDYVWGDEAEASTYVGTYHDNTWYLRRDADNFSLYLGGTRTTGTKIDGVSWAWNATSGYWPRDARFSMSLDPAALDATKNDSVDRWCATSSDASGVVAANTAWRWYDTPSSGLDEYGTPGAANYDCLNEVDADGDGYPETTDCNDADATVYPGATETCNGVDDNCDTFVDEGLGGGTWYADADGDGYGDATVANTSCTQPAGYVADGTDCDDASASVNPGAAEVCDDGVDNDCDPDPTVCEWTGSQLTKDEYGMRAYGTAASWAVGSSVANNGDLDGDGIADVVIGQSAYDATGITDNGRLYVWYGPVDSTDSITTYDLAIDGDTSRNNDNFGSSSRFVGDVDGDGTDDLMASAQKSHTDDRGTAYLFYGGTAASSVSGADASFSNASASAWTGVGIDGADVDGDLRSDVVISAYGTSSRTGQVGLWNATAITGGAESMSTDTTALFSGTTAGDEFGYALAMGDLDADGLAELIVAAPASLSTTTPGKAYVWTGVAGLSGAVAAADADAILSGSANGDRFGLSVAYLGDTDGDGTGDFAVTADKDDTSAADAGAAYLFTALPSGSATGASLASTIITGETGSDFFGRTVAGVGDVNGDGFRDAAFGATGYDPSGGSGGGSIYLFYGALANGTVSASTYDLQLTGANAADAVGYALAGGGDVDGDGNDDFMGGAPSWDGFGLLNAGGAWLWYGRGE